MPKMPNVNWIVTNHDWRMTPHANIWHHGRVITFFFIFPECQLHAVGLAKLIVGFWNKPAAVRKSCGNSRPLWSVVAWRTKLRTLLCVIRRGSIAGIPRWQRDMIGHRRTRRFATPIWNHRLILEVGRITITQMNSCYKVNNTRKFNGYISLEIHTTKTIKMQHTNWTVSKRSTNLCCRDLDTGPINWKPDQDTSPHRTRSC